MRSKADIWDNIKSVFLDIIKSVAGSIIGTIILTSMIYLGVLHFLQKTLIDQRLIFNIYVTMPMLLVSLIVLFLILIYFNTNFSRISLYNGRENAMEENLKLLQIREPKDRAHKTILSTRISFWPLEDNSPARVKFRNLLENKIENGVEIKRIWQIQSIDDLNRLKYYLDKYKNFDNLAINCFTGKTPLPEILSVYGKVVSVSIPQPNDPRKLTTAFHFYGNKEILRWDKYFEVLWQSSYPIKAGENINYENLDKLESELEAINNVK